MGTPDFAVESLRQLLEAGIEVAAVVTAPDRKAGRGQQISESAVKNFAKGAGLEILQPEKLKSDEFVERLKEINADLFVVVAFRMLPEIVWSMPPLGCINLHGSLLPQYRGAAPINWAVINGEEKTGATTFFIQQEIDTGDIIDHVEVMIGENDTAGDVHDELMVKGATLLVSTVQNILNGQAKRRDQLEGIDESDLKEAPKIFKPDCQIDWSQDCKSIHNKIRGLSPYPTAWAVIQSDNDQKSLKLFRSTYHTDGQSHTGEVTVKDGQLLLGCVDGWIIPSELQLEGKKRMAIEDFLRGFDPTSYRLN